MNPMIRNPDFDYLFVLLTGSAVAFMLWVFSKQIGKGEILRRANYSGVQ